MAAADRLKAETKDGSVVSGGQLVAEALKSAGVGARHERVAAPAL